MLGQQTEDMGNEWDMSAGMKLLMVLMVRVLAKIQVIAVALLVSSVALTVHGHRMR